MIENTTIPEQKTTSEKLLKYRSCIGDAMRGKKFERKEDRYKEFCESAKKCSGKSPDKAIVECKDKHPEWY